VIGRNVRESRELFVLAFAGWLGLCVYVGGFLSGNRAYGAALAGYHRCSVRVTQSTSPEDISTWRKPGGRDRGGNCALALVSDGFAAPNLHTGLSARLAAAQWRVRALARDILRGESANPIESANLLREITALRPDITASPPSRAADRRARAQPGAPPWHWLPRSAQQPHWHRSRAPCHLFAARLPMRWRGTRKPCSCACGSARGSSDAHAYDALFVRHAQELLIEDLRHKMPSKTCGRAATRHAISVPRSTARAGRPCKTHCARFWRW
jgi:hypothetical protein